MERFRRMKTLQTFAAVHGTVHNHFNQERHLISRDFYRERRSAALAESRNLQFRWWFRYCVQQWTQRRSSALAPRQKGESDERRQKGAQRTRSDATH